MPSLVSSGLGEIKASPKPAGKTAGPKLPGAPSKIVALPRASGKVFQGIPRTFSGAPKLQQAYRDTAKPARAPNALSALTKPVTSLAGLPKQGVPQKSSVLQEAKKLTSLQGLPKNQPQSKQGGGSPLASILNVPAEVERKGYGNIAAALGTSSVGGKIAHEAGNLAAEAVNLPTQILPAAYQLGHALGQAKSGKGQELHEMGSQFLKESPVAHIVKGDFSGALKAAGAHPIGSALEASGVAGAVDRTLGAVGRLSGVDAAKLSDAGASTVSRAPRQYPPEDVPPGGATVAQRPYTKGLVRPAVEKKVSAKPIPAGRVSPNLRRAYDRFEGEHLAITRATREGIAHHYNQTVGKTPVNGAVVPFGQWLADPKVINPETKVPFAREHLQEAVDHFSKAPKGEFAQEAKIREANVAHLKGLQGKDLNKPYQASLQVAREKRALEPELVKHRVYDPETIRAAKLIPAFRFHFRDQNPFVDTTVQKGESPFRLGGPEGKPIAVDQVAKQLEAKGVHENQLSFVSTRPFQNGNAAFRTGYTPGGAKVAKGHLSGHAFMRGQFDPTTDAALRQHLTDAGIINKARGDLRFSQEYVHSRANIARLLEARMDRLPADQRTALHDYIQKDLRSGPGMHFEGGKSPWQQAQGAQEHLKALYPDIKLEPIRVAHPYATKPYRQGLGQHLDLGAAQDMLDPSNHGPEQDFWKTRVPQEAGAQHDVTAGPVGLVHQEIVDRVRAYEKDLGLAHLSRMPASFWRKTNVAFSVRHIPGVAQEVGARLAANNVGPLSIIRGTRASAEIQRYGMAHPDPFVKLGAQRQATISGGTVAGQALEQMRHVTPGQLANTPLAKAAEWWNKGEARPITGAPLRAVRGAVKTFNGATNSILSFERKVVEHPPQVAGLGKHYNQEFQRLHGQRLKVIGAFSDVEKSFLHGQLDPKAIDHAASISREYWGNWTRASPEFKNYQRVSPFLQWYLNSLHFLYHVMPVHHPIQTGVMTAIEGATHEQRLAEGQEYKGGFHLNPTDLEPSQQGSIPYGKGERAGQEYYTPQGAVSAGPLETTLGAVLPYASGIWSVLHGVNPLTNRPLEEKNAEGKKERITDQQQLALLGAMSAAESFFPPLRYAQSLSKKPASYVFRPLRTEKTRLEVPAKREKAIKLGPGLGTSLGSSLRTSLK
jgi:hypothetical protein